MTKRIRVCPKCFSSEIAETKNIQNGWKVPPSYACLKEGCGYSGTVFAELETADVEKAMRVINAEPEPEKAGL
ncbi:MAG: hypothetical protein JSW61_06530 [Candidatus Thorarchaeota archaeon]|nr:MAG: hypothetical protein JSW61_06530 [Candidatus Thorarchaeota archaeon]